MKIGVISDTHGSVERWQRAMEGPFRDVSLILHAGDILYHGPRNPLPEGFDPLALTREINNLQTPLLIARGNCDSEVDQMVLDVPIQSPHVFTQTPMGNIYVTHGHRETRMEAVALAKRYKVDFWISGHTHIPEVVNIEGVWFVNPGSPSLPKGDLPRSTVAIITEEAVSLYDLDAKEDYLRVTLG